MLRIPEPDDCKGGDKKQKIKVRILMKVTIATQKILELGSQRAGLKVNHMTDVLACC